MSITASGKAEPALDIRALYDGFDAPVVPSDCGLRCAPHNPSGKPFCCDICHAVPAAFGAEWEFLQPRTDLWHVWRGDECPAPPAEVEKLRAETPAHMLLLACKGPAHCQRPFRALSCRQFPFFPYITADGRFIGLAYEWNFEAVCWVVSNLEQVTPAFRDEFVRHFDALLAEWDEEFESYAALSAELRAAFAARRRRIPLLHRNGGDYWVSPLSGRLHRGEAAGFPRHGVYLQG
jgi:hypothetical protein